MQLFLWRVPQVLVTIIWQHVLISAVANIPFLIFSLQNFLAQLLFHMDLHICQVEGKRLVEIFYRNATEFISKFGEEVVFLKY